MIGGGGGLLERWTLMATNVKTFGNFSTKIIK